MNFDNPQVLLALLLTPLFYRYIAGNRRSTSCFLRCIIFVIAVLILSGLHVGLPEPGVDIITLVDHSASCSAQSKKNATELIPLISDNGPQNRYAVIDFDRKASISKNLNSAQALAADSDANGSNIAQALTLASQMRDPKRKSAVLLISDGNYTGKSPLSPEVLSSLKGMPVWIKDSSSGISNDIAAGEIVLPAQVSPLSAWPVRFSIYSQAAQTATYKIMRNNSVISSAEVKLSPGENVFFARDTAQEEGMIEYRLEVSAENENLKNNNSSTALLQVKGIHKVMLVTPSKEAGIIAKALKASAIKFDQITPEQLPAAPAEYSPYKVIILENTPLTKSPYKSTVALADSIRNGLCSLLITGGANSFALGGYHHSPVDKLLPVSMELQEVTKRGAIALAIAMDRSGSMMAPAGNGKSKIDLVNIATAESINLLSPFDQISVIPVDTSAHILVPLSRADNTQKLIDTVMRIQSMGGGIYVRQALTACGKELEKSMLPTKHIILFADAADSEMQGGCIKLAQMYRKQKISMSVIAMGTPADSDAKFLRELAKASGSEAIFSNDINNLPQIFTQEVIRASQRSFVAEPTKISPLPSLSELAPIDKIPDLTVGGYNFTSLREGATAYAIVDDEFKSPLIAYRYNGKYSTAALTFEADGEFSGDFPKWDKAPEVIISLIRKLAGDTRHADIKAYSNIKNGLANVEIELSEKQAKQMRGKNIKCNFIGPDRQTFSSELKWKSPTTAYASIEIEKTGHYLPVIDIEGEGLIKAPPVSTSYSAEFSHQHSNQGESFLKQIAENTGGGSFISFDDIAESASRITTGSYNLRPALLILALFLILLEIVNRRLCLFA